MPTQLSLTGRSLLRITIIFASFLPSTLLKEHMKALETALVLSSVLL
jgi:hypothetical protein